MIFLGDERKKKTQCYKNNVHNPLPAISLSLGGHRSTICPCSCNSLSKLHYLSQNTEILCFIFVRFQEILNCLFQNREEIRQEYLKLEMLLKENELKSFYQQQCHKQIEMMCSEDKVEKVFNNFIINS